MKLSVLFLCLLASALSLHVNNNSLESAPDYSQALRLSLFFYEAQRSGRLPHTNRLPWRSHSMLQDGATEGLDLSGGYFESDCHLKNTYATAAVATVLAWGLIDYRAGYEAAEEFENGKDAVKWATDYLIKAHASPTELYGLVGNRTADLAFWGRPEDWVGERPAFKVNATHPGSDLAGEASAALAAAFILFKEDDLAYANSCLEHAQDLYSFAVNNRDVYNAMVPLTFYRSSGYGDELAWSAIWLYRATNEQRYLQDANKFIVEFSLLSRPNFFNWDVKTAGVQVLMAKLTNETTAMTAIESFCDYVINEAPRSPKGLVLLKDFQAAGYNSEAANAAFVCMQAATAGVNPQIYYNFAKEQIDYVLGHATGQSFVIGYGETSPSRPYHRSSSCPNRPAACDKNALESETANPQTLYGALVGGPDVQDSYNDKRLLPMNGVRLESNSGFTSALAGLITNAGSKAKL